MVRITYTKVYFGHSDQGIIQEVPDAFKQFMDSEGVKRVSVHGVMFVDELPFIWASYSRSWHRFTPDGGEEFKTRKEMSADMEERGMTRDAEEVIIEWAEEVWEENDNGKWHKIIDTGDDIEGDSDEYTYSRWKAGEWEECDEDDDDSGCDHKHNSDEEGGDDEWEEYEDDDIEDDIVVSPRTNVAAHLVDYASDEEGVSDEEVYDGSDSE
jgi:hypothetical protein